MKNSLVGIIDSWKMEEQIKEEEKREMETNRDKKEEKKTKRGR